MQTHSEVTRLRERIEAKTAAAYRAIYDPALGTAKHSFITARMENVERCRKELASIVGDERSMQLLCQAMNDAQTSSAQG